MKFFLILFLLTTSLYAQDVYLENAVPANGLIDSGDYQTILNNNYLNSDRKAYYENRASIFEYFLHSTNETKCNNLATLEEKANCYEDFATTSLYGLQIFLKEALDASEISGFNINNEYISRTIDKVFDNVKYIKGEYTPVVVNNIGSPKKSFFNEGQEINNQISYGDINGDGYDDFVTRYIEDGQTKIITRLSYGDGSFGDIIPDSTTPITYDDPAETFYQTLGSITRKNPFYLYDVNGDGKEDIVFVYHENGLKVRVRLSDGRGKFSEIPIDSPFNDGSGVLAQSINGLTVEHDIRFIDMDNDGILDMVYVHYYGGLRIRVRHGLYDTDADGNITANGKFSNTLNVNEAFDEGNDVMVQHIGLQKINHKMNIVDINNDNYPDLAYVNSDDGHLRVRVRLSDDAGKFLDLKEETFKDGTLVFGTTIEGKFIPHDFHFSDVDNDGFPDLIYMHHKDGLKVRVKLSNQDGTFRRSPQQNFTDGTAAIVQNIDGVLGKNKIQIIDINNDNNGDLVYRIKSSTGMQIRIRLSNLDGTFSKDPILIRNEDVQNKIDYSYPIEFADFNDNKKKDIVNYRTVGINTYLNRIGLMPHMPYQGNVELPQFSSKDKRENENRLDLTQFMFLVSRYLNITKETTGNKAKILEDYLNKWILEFPQYSLGQWNNRGTYYTHKTLMKYQQLQDDNSEYNPEPIYEPLELSPGVPFKAHTSAIRDVDLWIMASLIEYLSYDEGLNPDNENKLSDEKLSSYKNYLNQALGLVKSRIVEAPVYDTEGPLGIKFDIGKRKDLEDSNYGAFTGTIPTIDVQCETTNQEITIYNLNGIDPGNNDEISYDFGHAYRYVDVFESFKSNNTLGNISELEYFNESFMEKLANQVVYALYDPLIETQGELTLTVPLFKNYFNGKYNGWYRVNYGECRNTFGFAPHQKSGSFIAGGFARLGKYNSDLAKLSVDLWNFRQSSIGSAIDKNYSDYFVPDTFDKALDGQGNQANTNRTNDVSFFSAIASYGTNYSYKETTSGPKKIYIIDPNIQNRKTNILNEINTSTTYEEIKIYNMYGRLVKVFKDKKIIDLKNEFSGLYMTKTISKENTKTGKFMF